MNSKLKTIIFGGLVAGSLIMSAAPVMAWDWPNWFNGTQRSDNRSDRQTDHRSDNRGGDNNRGGSRSDYEQLQQARQQALYDASHHASRKKIAEDDAIANDIENRMHHRR
jgi:hypothetical protein